MSQPPEDTVPVTDAGPAEITVTLRGSDVRRVLDDLIASLATEKNDKQVILRGIGVLHQAIGKRVTLTDSAGNTLDLHGLWK